VEMPLSIRSVSGSAGGATGRFRPKLSNYI
jgi:hypothetical protein